MKNKKLNTKKLLNNIFKTIIILISAFIIGLAITSVSESVCDLRLVFLLAVMLVSRFTEGYFFGVLASLLSVFCINYVFTYPYFAFNFTISGYPLTFIMLFSVSLMISMLTTQIKDQANITAEIEIEKNRANLLRAVSHDIRTPLTSIIGSSSAFLDNSSKLSDEEKNTLISDIRDEADWLIKIVENILSITRISNEDAKIEKRPEVIEEIIGETVGKFKKQHPDIRLSVSVPDDILFIPMDATLIEQVILNILENCVCHGVHTTNIDITVTNDSHYAKVKISDNGIGIKPDVIPHLFSGYFTLDKEDTLDTKRNMGIGLSVCMSIIRAHNGDMTAYNQKNGGAVFEFTLPL